MNRLERGTIEGILMHNGENVLEITTDNGVGVFVGKADTLITFKSDHKDLTAMIGQKVMVAYELNNKFFISTAFIDCIITFDNEVEFTFNEK